MASIILFFFLLKKTITHLLFYPQLPSRAEQLAKVVDKILCPLPPSWHALALETSLIKSPMDNFIEWYLPYSSLGIFAL